MCFFVKEDLKIVITYQQVGIHQPARGNIARCNVTKIRMTKQLRRFRASCKMVQPCSYQSPTLCGEF